MNGPAAAGAEPRPPELRYARLHLRVGALALARAELEALVGTGELDGGGLLDLAEARWRTGDVIGAGEPARLVIEGGEDSPLALVIAAEAAAAGLRPDEARHLAERAVSLAGDRLDDLFAGMPRSPIWPAEVLGRRAGPHGGAPIRVPADAPPASEPPPLAAPDPLALSPDPAAELASARLDLRLGRPDLAAVRLSLLLRAAPEQAPAVLAFLDGRDDPALALVVGDAHQLAGRTDLARAAWSAARRHLAPSTASRPPPPPDATHPPGRG